MFDTTGSQVISIKIPLWMSKQGNLIGAKLTESLLGPIKYACI